MRSIGKVNIRKLKVIVKGYLEEQENSIPYPYGLDYAKAREDIDELIPDNWFKIWELAWSEISRLIDDELTEYSYRRFK